MTVCDRPGIRSLALTAAAARTTDAACTHRRFSELRRGRAVLLAMKNWNCVGGFVLASLIAALATGGNSQAVAAESVLAPAAVVSEPDRNVDEDSMRILVGPDETSTIV